MAREEVGIKNSVSERTCRYCGRVYQYPAGARFCEDEYRIDKAPTFKVGERLTLDPKVFAERYPKLEPTSNLFVIAGPLFRGQWDDKAECGLRTRTMNCLIGLDLINQRHYYDVRIRLIGEASWKEERLIFVRARDLTSVSAPNPEPKPAPAPGGDHE
jgi:hypothetical protein